MEGFVINADVIIKIASVIGAISVIGGVVFGIYKWIVTQKEKDERHDKEIASMKEENALIVFALSACLDGLQQLGANHTVPIAKDKLDKWINLQAHK